MTGMSRQRDAYLHAHAPAGWLLAALLVPACALAGGQTATTPQAEPAIHATRGVSANAAREAASAQLEQVRPVGTAPVDGAQPATPAEPVVVPVDAGGSASVDADARRPWRWGRVSRHLRGVIFRITPPAVTLLPAEAGQVPATTPGDPASSTVAATAPPRPSYLLGTIHFGTPEEQGIDYARLEALLGETDTFVNEANLDEAWKSEYDGYRWLPVETPLEAMVGKDAMTLAHALLPTVRPQDLQRMKPWSVLALLEARGESGSDATMDARLQRMAKLGPWQAPGAPGDTGAATAGARLRAGPGTFAGAGRAPAHVVDPAHRIGGSDGLLSQSQPRRLAGQHRPHGRVG